MNVKGAPPPPDTGFIGPGLHPWWAGGVLVAGVFARVVTGLTLARETPALAWGPLLFALVFVVMFDTRGVFRAGRLVAAIAATIAIQKLVLHVRWPGKFVMVAILAVLIAVYGLAGAMGMEMGAKQRRRPNA